MVLLLSSSWSDFVAFACAGGGGGRAPSQAAKWKELDSSPFSSFLSVPTRLKVKVVPGGIGSGEESSHNRALLPTLAAAAATQVDMVGGRCKQWEEGIKWRGLGGKEEKEERPLLK